MNDLVKERLAKFYSLPVELMTDEADLYLLSILSLYFREDQGKRDGIKITDVDVANLSLSRKELIMDEEGSKLDIYLSPLLKKDIPVAIRERAYYKDHIGRDGFSNHLLETVLCIMELSDAFGWDFMEFPDDDETKRRVKDLIQFIVQNNFKTIEN